MPFLPFPKYFPLLQYTCLAKISLKKKTQQHFYECLCCNSNDLPKKIGNGIQLRRGSRAINPNNVRLETRISITCTDWGCFLIDYLYTFNFIAKRITLWFNLPMKAYDQTE